MVIASYGLSVAESARLDKSDADRFQKNIPAQRDRKSLVQLLNF